jgi:23S rRNA pseudouridine2605 synthase
MAKTPDDAVAGAPREASRDAPGGERLHRLLAHAGVASRRHAEQLMAAGRVTVNGVVVRQPGARADAARDDVRVDGQPVRVARAHTYVLLHKPHGPVTTASDPQGRATVLDLLPADLRARRLYPVGRLDRSTEGLLLLTDDGALALRLTHPRYALAKEYRALVRGRPTAAALDRLRRGVPLAGEARPTAPQPSGSPAWRARTPGLGWSCTRGATARCGACWRRWSIRCASCGAYVSAR